MEGSHGDLDERVHCFESVQGSALVLHIQLTWKSLQYEILDGCFLQHIYQPFYGKGVLIKGLSVAISQ